MNMNYYVIIMSLLKMKTDWAGPDSTSTSVNIDDDMRHDI